MIEIEIVSVTIAGANGSASGNADTRHPLNGKLLAIYVDYNTQPSTTDVTITTKRAPIKTLLTLTDANTDGWFYPRYVVHSEAGVALTGTAGGDRTVHPLADDINVAVAGGNAGTLDFHFLYER